MLKLSKDLIQDTRKNISVSPIMTSDSVNDKFLTPDKDSPTFTDA